MRRPALSLSAAEGTALVIACAIAAIHCPRMASVYDSLAVRIDDHLHKLTPASRAHPPEHRPAGHTKTTNATTLAH